MRERAARNLGALTTMSARVDQLATDLAAASKCVAGLLLVLFSAAAAVAAPSPPKKP